MKVVTADILAARGAKNNVDPWRPYAYWREHECTAAGRIEPVATLFLTNRECPFRCLMCDLWKNTTDETVPPGAIPEQIRFALHELAEADHIKLYNSGNFFDPRAIPPADYPAILELIQPFRTVIVENHPRFCNAACMEFGSSVDGDLEVAIGLETIHPDVLPALNKQMTTEDFKESVQALAEHGIFSRAFILLRPPSLTEQEGVDWSLRSIEFAFDAGVRVCSVIPTRGGNGIMERLADRGQFEPPSLSSLETVLAEGIKMNRGRVFVDLWDAEKFGRCAACTSARVERLNQMNLQQAVLPEIRCGRCPSDPT